MAENQGMIETMTGAMSQAILNVAHRKVGIAVVGMWLLSKAPTAEEQTLICLLCIVALGAQLIQDVVEVIWTGKDLPDTNGNGSVRAIETSSVPVQKLSAGTNGKTSLVEDEPEDMGTLRGFNFPSAVPPAL